MIQHECLVGMPVGRHLSMHELHEGRRTRTTNANSPIAKLALAASPLSPAAIQPSRATAFLCSLSA